LLLTSREVDVVVVWRFAEFERQILRERVRAGIAQARKESRPHGRPRTALRKEEEVERFKAEHLSNSETARRLGIGRTSVRRILAAGSTRMGLRPPARVAHRASDGLRRRLRPTGKPGDRHSPWYGIVLS